MSTLPKKIDLAVTERTVRWVRENRAESPLSRFEQQLRQLTQYRCHGAIQTDS